MEDGDYLVPGRECGECTVCCKDLAIAEDDMTKLPGVACEHCTQSKGCAIYDARPNVCRSYHCLWRSLPTVDESWRPDRSGILMMLGDAPPEFPSGFAVDLILVGRPETLQSDGFAGLVGGFIESGTATYLNVPAAPGFLACHGLLNDTLAPAIAARDLATVKALIASAYDDIRALPSEPIRPGDMQRRRA